MVDVVPVVVFVIGLVALVKPEWVANIDRKQKSLGTNRSPNTVEMSETYYLVVRIVGIICLSIGLIFIVQSW